MSFFRRRPRQVRPRLHDGASCADADQEIQFLKAENKQLREELDQLRARAWGIGVDPDRDPREEQERLRAVAFAARRLLASLDCGLHDVGLVADKLRYRLDQLDSLGGPPPRPVPPGVWRSGPSTPPATAPEEDS